MSQNLAHEETPMLQNSNENTPPNNPNTTEYSDDDQDVVDGGGATIGLSIHNLNQSITGSSLQNLDDPENNDEDNTLFLLCERVASSSHNPEAFDTVDIEDMWSDIREWLAMTDDPEARFNALRPKGEFQTTALHLTCKALDPPEDIIKQFLRINRDVASMTDGFSWIPLHYACANGASPNVLIALLDANPDGNITQDRRKRTPLHFLLGMSSSSNRAAIYKNNSEAFPEVVRILSENDALKICDENGMLALHYACAFGMSASVLQVLLSYYPESVSMVDNRRRTAVHFVMGNPAREASPHILRLILSMDLAAQQETVSAVNNSSMSVMANSHVHKILNMRNKDGHLPIHLLNVQSSRIPASPKELRMNACEVLLVYLDAKPNASADFLTALGDLPDWLRDTAVSHAHVQHILNKKISQCFPTSILLGDGFFMMVLILCFYLASDYTFKYRYGDADEKVGFRWDLFGLYFSASYFLQREVVQMMSLMKLGSFKTWLFDVGNLLDLLLITSVFYFTVDMQYHLTIDKKDFFRTGIAVTYGIAWISVISYLKSIYIDFSVFVGGVIYVVRRLAAFLMALGIILIAYAQMFAILYRQTDLCDPEINPNYYPHCEFMDSFLRVFIMLVGAVNMADYQTSVTATILYVLFAFLVVILLSNVLIAVVSDSYGVIKNQRASIVFWSNRLNFIAEMGAISSVFQPFASAIQGCFCRRKTNVDPASMHHATGMISGNFSTEPDMVSMKSMHTGNNTFKDLDDFDETKNSAYSNLMRSIWSKLLSIYEDEDFTLSEFWLITIMRIFSALVIIPLWLIIGLASFGWLWPPQVREWLFVQRITNITKADVENIISKQVLDLKTDVLTLREDLLEVMNADEKDLSDIKNETNKTKEVVVNDMRVIRELLSTLVGGGVLAEIQEEEMEA